MNNIIGMDLDGVIAKATMKYTEGGIYKKYETCIPLLNPVNDKVIIITGRKPRFKQVTLDWLEKYNIQYSEIHFNDEINKRKNFQYLAEYKVRKINKLNIGIYIEDTPEIAIRIQYEVPECKVMLFYNNNLFTLNKV